MKRYNKLKAFVCLYIMMTMLLPTTFGLSEEENVNAAVEQYFILSQEIHLHEQVMERLKTEVDALENKLHVQTMLLDKKSKTQQELLLKYGDLLRSQQTGGKYRVLTQILNASSIRDMISKFQSEKILSNKVEAVYQLIQTERMAIETLGQSIAYEKERLVKKVEQLRFESSAYDQKFQAQSKLVQPYVNQPFFMAKVNALNIEWQSIQPTFKNKIESFNILIQNQILPESIFDLSRKGLTLEATLIEVRFNEALKTQSLVEDMSFKFSTKGIEIYFETLDVKLVGNFELISAQNIGFDIQEVYFKDYLVSVVALEHFLDDIQLQFDLTEMLGKSTIEKIEVKHGEIILTVQLKLF